MATRRGNRQNSNNKFNWSYLIPGYGTYLWTRDVIKGVGQLIHDMSAKNVANTLNENDPNVYVETPTYNDVNGQTQIETNPSDPVSSASNVIDYDPNKSAQENLLHYAQENNSASAYDAFLQNEYSSEMSNTAISRAIADAEANGISKYQLFQSGNMAASSPSSAASSYRSYEGAMDRRNSLNEKELQFISAVITSTISSAFGLFGKMM